MKIKSEYIVGNSFGDLARFWSSKDDILPTLRVQTHNGTNKPRKLNKAIKEVKQEHQKSQVVPERNIISDHPCNPPSLDYYAGLLQCTLAPRVTAERMYDIRKLSRKDTFVENGVTEQGKPIELGEVVSCIDFASGQIMAYKGKYLGMSNFGSHVIEGVDKVIYDTNGLVFRRHGEPVNFTDYVIDKRHSFVFYGSEKDSEKDIELAKLVKGRIGQMFFVKTLNNNRIVTCGRYEGFHVNDDQNIVLWFDGGKCLEVKEPLVLIPQLSNIIEEHKPEVATLPEDKSSPKVHASTQPVILNGTGSFHKTLSLKDRIKLLAKSDTAIEKGIVIGPEIEPNNLYSCIDMVSGALIIPRGEYIKQNDSGAHLFSTAIRPVWDNTGIVLRKHLPFIDLSSVAPSGKADIVFDPNENRKNLELAEGLEARNGELFLAKWPDGKLILASEYKGFHQSNNGNIILWFANGRCIEVRNHKVKLIPHKEAL